MVLSFAVPVRAADPLAKMASQFYNGIITEKLPNGLVVILKPIPGSPVVTTKVVYKVGSCDEELAHTGLSHYLEHLMFKGTAKLFPGDIDRKTQQNGGRNNAYTSEDYTCYHFDFAADRWTTALDIEADRMRNLVIDEKHEFEQEKGAVISELAGNEDEAWDRESKAILPLLFGPKAPYGHPVIGEREHVKDSTAAIIKKHYDRWYHPNNAILIVVGGFDPIVALKEIKSRFTDIKSGELPPRFKDEPVPVRTKIVRKEITANSGTPRMIMGFNGVKLGEPEDYIFDVIVTVLADGKTSRLHKKLIQEEGSAADVSGANLAGRYPGWVSILVESLGDVERKDVETQVLAEIEKIATKGITDVELKRVQRRLLAQIIFQQEDVHEAADRIAMSAAHFDDARYAQTYLERITSVTNEDVMRIAKKWLVDAKPVIVWSVPEKICGTGRPIPRHSKFCRFLDTVPKVGASTFSLDKATRKVLPNGMTILLLENHRLPIVSLKSHVRDSLLREPANQVGIAAMTGVLMEDGTPTRNADEIAELVENIGAEFEVSITGGHFKVLTPDLDTVLDSFFDCTFHADFPQDEFESKQELLLETIVEQQQDADHRARETFDRLVYGDHPYGRPALGKSKVVKGLTRNDCVKYHKTVVRPDQMIVAIVGDFDSKAVLAKLETLTPEKPKKPLPKLEVPEPPVGDEFVDKIITDDNSSQVYIYLGQIGIRRNNADYYKLLVMDNVLGSGVGFTDRLSSNLRDRQGLAYTVRASITDTADIEPGLFLAHIGTAPDKYIQARDGLMKEIRKIRDEQPSAEEVTNAKQYLLGSLPFQYATNDDMAYELVTVDEFGLGLDYLTKYREAVSAVTAADVQAVAKKYLDPEKFTLVAVGPIDKKGVPLKKEKE